MRPLRTERDFPDVAGGLILGLLAIAAPLFLAEWLGYGQTLADMIDMFGSFWPCALAALYGISFLIIGSVLHGLCLLAGLSAFGGNLLLDRGAALIARVIRKLVGWLAAIAGLFALVLSRLLRPLQAWCHERLVRLREERALWQRYRGEFYQAYASYAEFKRAYYGSDEADAEEPRGDTTASTTLDQAFALFGLSAACSREDFETRFRDLMKQVHPDRAGPNGMATQLNEARTLIRTQKGWK